MANSRHRIFIYQSFEAFELNTGEIDAAYDWTLQQLKENPVMREQGAFLEGAAEAAGLTDMRTLIIPHSSENPDTVSNQTQVVYGLSDRGLGELDDVFRSYSGERAEMGDFTVVDVDEILIQIYEDGDYDTGSFSHGANWSNVEYEEHASKTAQDFLRILEGE